MHVQGFDERAVTTEGYPRRFAVYLVMRNDDGAATCVDSYWVTDTTLLEAVAWARARATEIGGGYEVGARVDMTTAKEAHVVWLVSDLDPEPEADPGPPLPPRR